MGVSKSVIQGVSASPRGLHQACQAPKGCQRSRSHRPDLSPGPPWGAGARRGVPTPPARRAARCLPGARPRCGVVPGAEVPRPGRWRTARRRGWRQESGRGSRGAAGGPGPRRRRRRTGPRTPAMRRTTRRRRRSLAAGRPRSGTTHCSPSGARLGRRAGGDSADDTPGFSVD